MQKRIVILEDNEKVKTELRYILSQAGAGWKIVFFERIEIAILYLKSNHADLLVIDLKLDTDQIKEWSGLYFARRIRLMEEYYNTPIVFISPKSKVTHIVGNITFYIFIETIQNKELFVFLLKKLLFLDVEETWITLRDRGRSFNFKIEDIVYGEIFRRTFTLKTIKESIVIPYLSMKEFLKKVSSYPIYQCHRSYAINVNFIMSINKMQNSILLIDSYGTIRLGTTYKKSILEKFEKET
ncbi:MAG: LytTR family transcriptional regulator DNA-binding domain-containing protein [Lachnoclostridium sp.]|jgi:two-component system LytT family response regulator|nr:LytTR family transcriptional regulator DNA-binding domain-containing protein [Lachnoclostridium sp.]